jgi:uncharacterized membrane protein YgcG
LAAADRQFGSSDRRVARLTDKSGMLDIDGRERVEQALDDFERRFPQLFAAVYTDRLDDPGQLRTYGFWLLNRGVFEHIPPGLGNESGILLLLDPVSKSAGFTFGYLLDPYLDENDTFECLARAHSHFLEGNHPEGILKALHQLEWFLRRRALQARRNLYPFERRVQPAITARPTPPAASAR